VDAVRAVAVGMIEQLFSGGVDGAINSRDHCLALGMVEPRKGRQ
jgi:hypothetical protein